MTTAATRVSVVDRIRRDGRTAEALGLVLDRAVNGSKTTAIRCLDSSHEDRNASAVIEPRNGRVTCRGCGRSWGLLELAILRGHASDLPGVARHLEARLYGVANARPPGSTTPSRLRNPHPPRLNAEVSVPVPPEVSSGKRPESSATPFPFVPDEIVRSLGWKLSRHQGRVDLRAPVLDANLALCAIKVCGPEADERRLHGALPRRRASGRRRAAGNRPADRHGRRRAACDGDGRRRTHLVGELVGAGWNRGDRAGRRRTRPRSNWHPRQDSNLRPTV